MSVDRTRLTEAELKALHALGYEWFNENSHDTHIAEAYRAGFRDGSKPPEPRVFLQGDPEPGPEITVIDEDGDAWSRDGGLWWLGSSHYKHWDDLQLCHGPLVAGVGVVSPMSYYHAAIAADRERRNAEQAAGGAPVSADIEQLRQAAELVISTQFPSPSMLQRKLKVNYARAAALMDELERIGVVGPPQGLRPRNVLIPEDRLVEFMATMAGGVR